MKDFGWIIFSTTIFVMALVTWLCYSFYSQNFLHLLVACVLGAIVNFLFVGGPIQHFVSVKWIMWPMVMPIFNKFIGVKSEK